MLRSECLTKLHEISLYGSLIAVSPNSDVTMVTDPDVVICGSSPENKKFTLILSPPSVLPFGAFHLLRGSHRNITELASDPRILLPPTLADFHLLGANRILFLQKSKCSARPQIESSLVPIP
jgi:hypothetical protein